MKKPKKKILLTLIALAIMAVIAVLVIRARGSDPARILARADEYFAAEQYDSARIEYSNLIREQPENSYAYQQIGFGFLEQGLPLRAIPWLGKSLDLSPQNPEAKGKLASIVFSLGDLGGARRLALEVLDQEPADEAAILLLANTSQPSQEDAVAEVGKRLAQFDDQKQAVFHLVKAILASRSGGELEETKAMLDRALSLEPKSVPVHLSRATYFQVTRDIEMLRESLAAAAKASPVRSSARVRYAAFLAQSGEADEAQKQLEELTSQAQDYLPAWIGLAEIAASKKEYTEALGHLDKVIQRDPLNYTASMTKAQVLLAQNDLDGATTLLEKLDDSDRAGIPIHKVRVKLSLARIYSGTGELDNAASILEEAVSVLPGLPEPILALAQVNLRRGSTTDAIAPLETLLKSAPGMTQAEMLLAQAYRIEGRLDAAANIFRNQIKRDPTQSEPHFMLGLILRGLQLPGEARVALEKAQELAPDDQGITFQLIALDLENEDFEAAHRRAAAQLGEEGSEQEWGAHYLQGKIYFAEKKWTEAEKVLLRALELKPESLSIYNLLIDTYIASEDQPRAILQLEDLLKGNPKSLRHRMLLALLHEQEENFAEAAEAYGQLLKDAPDFIPALNNLAYLNSEMFGEFEKAYALATKAHDLAPNDAGIADTLGWILFKKQKYSQALTLLEEAANLSPDQPEIQYHLGMARAQMGQSEAARIALKNASESEAKFRGKKEAAERLAQLGGSVGKKTVEQLEEQVAKRPKDVPALTQLGILYEKEGRHAKAATAFEAALNVNSDLLAPLIGLARLYTGTLKESDQDAAKALGFAERARDLAPGNPEAGAVRALVALRKGEFEFAYNLLRSALRDADAAKNPLFQSAMGHAAYGKGRIDEARDWMSKVTAAASTAAADAKAAAGSFLALTEPRPADQEALKILADLVRKQLSIDPEDLPASMLRWLIDPEMDQEAAYKKILERVGNFVPAQSALAVIYARDPNRYKEALALTQKVDIALPDDPTNTQTRGILSYHMDKDADFAIQLLKSVDELKALDAEGLFYLGMAYLKEDQSEAGVKALEKSLEAGLSEALSLEAKAAIAEVNKPE